MNKRVDGLNFIRILGMTMILLFHAWLLYGFSVGIPCLDQMISIGAIFVTVFFMLSGFGLRKSNGDLSIQDLSSILKYYRKRVLSIYPLFLLLTIVALIFQFRVMDSVGKTLLHLPIQFSMLHILFGKEMHGFLFNDNCWYISALFVLYLLFPVLNTFLNWFSNRFGVFAKICLCVILWIISVGIYFYFVYYSEYVFLDYYPNPFFRIPEFMIGMILGDLTEEDIFRKMHNLFSGSIVIFTIAFISICLPILYPYFAHETNLYNIIVIPCTAVIFLCISNGEWVNRIGSTKLVRWLAGLGLEMYLCQSFATLTLTYMKVDGAWDEIVFMGLTVVYAVVVNTVFHKPIMKIRKQ